MSGQDPLEDQALEIATEHLLKGRSLHELSQVYAASASTLQRRLAAWRQEGRFELIDKRRIDARVVRRDERLEEELALRTLLWRARVVHIEGVEAAGSEDYLADPSTRTALAAFRAADELHRALGVPAAEHVASSLRRHGTVGLASGRGVGFTVSALEELAARQPSWIGGFQTVRLESLCGGGHVGTWATPVARDLDADQNVFALAAVLGVDKANVDFMGGWIASSQARPAKRRSAAIDLALVGLGQLNSRHHFLHHYQAVQLGEMAEPLKTIRALQQADPTLVASVADIAHRVFLVGPGPFPSELESAVRELNDATLSVEAERLKEAGEVVLVAGGAQKVPALAGLLADVCPAAPVDLARVTLVTDAASAEGILRAATSLGDGRS